MKEELPQFLSLILNGLISGTATSGREFFLFSKILEVIVSSGEKLSLPFLSGNDDCLDDSGSSKQCSGQEYKGQVLKMLCETEWPKNVILNLTHSLKDLHFTEDQLKMVSSKLCEYTC